MGRYEEAFKCYKQATKIDPKYDVAWYNMGASLAALGRLKAAISCFEETLELNAGFEEAREAKRKCLEALKEMAGENGP